MPFRKDIKKVQAILYLKSGGIAKHPYNPNKKKPIPYGMSFYLFTTGCIFF